MGFTKTEKTQMITSKTKTRKIKTLGVALILSAAIASPVFAQGAAPHHVRHQSSFELRNGAPDDGAPQTPEEMRNLQNFGFSGRCTSCVGGESPDLNPAS